MSRRALIPDLPDVRLLSTKVGRFGGRTAVHLIELRNGHFSTVYLEGRAELVFPTPGSVEYDHTVFPREWIYTRPEPFLDRVTWTFGLALSGQQESGPSKRTIGCALGGATSVGGRFVIVANITVDGQFANRVTQDGMSPGHPADHTL